MLKLKYLFHDVNLAEMILKNWAFDADSTEMFKHFRISSNAIYPFRWEGKIQLLRFAPKTEKLKSNVQAELEFIAYLRANGYGAMEAVESKQGETLIEVQTPWGDYYASVFKRVPGVQVSRTDCSDSIIGAYGKALGRLHFLSSQYEPCSATRWSYEDVLDWIHEILMEGSDTAALKEVEGLRTYFSKIPKSQASYGLVHYDFEFDNTFYEAETQSCHAIDFDDAMYHWYAMDIAQALDCLEDGITAEDLNLKKQIFLQSYQAEFELPADWEKLLPACFRFASLYGYARILRASAEKWNHEPDWLAHLRGKLTKGLERKSGSFGKEL